MVIFYFQNVILTYIVGAKYEQLITLYSDLISSLWNCLPQKFKPNHSGDYLYYCYEMISGLCQISLHFGYNNLLLF
jgi:hypothetical protein